MNTGKSVTIHVKKHIKSMQCSLYRLHFQYYLQVIKEHNHHESKYPQLILPMLYKASVPKKHIGTSKALHRPSEQLTNGYEP